MSQKQKKQNEQLIEFFCNLDSKDQASLYDWGLTVMSEEEHRKWIHCSEIVMDKNSSAVMRACASRYLIEQMASFTKEM